MKRKKFLWALIAIFLLLPAATLGICYGLLRSERFIHSYLVPTISDATGIRITVQKASIKPFREISLDGVRINCDAAEKQCGATEPFSLTADSLRVTYTIWDLLSRKLNITSLQGDGVRVFLVVQPSPDNQPQNSAGAPARQESPKLTKPPFTIHVANASLKNSSVRYTDPSSSSSYLFDTISIDIPKADSHGKSEIQLRTVVSIQSPSLSLQRELLSGSVTLHEATMFTPRSVTLKAKVGSLQPTPLELQGSLHFADAPYALRSINIAQAIIRHTLPTTLSSQSSLFREFELELKGRYPLGDSAPVDISLLVNKAITPSSSNLKGSTLSSTFKIRGGSIAAEKGQLELVSQGVVIANGSVSGSVAFDPYTKPSKLSINAREVNFDAIEALFIPPTTSGSESQAPDGAPRNAQPPAEGKSTSAAHSLASTRIPLIDANLTIDKTTYQKLGISNLSADLTVPTPRTIQRATLAATVDGAGSISASLSGSLDSSLSVKASAKNMNVLPLAALAQGEGELLEGLIDLLDVDLSLAPANPRATITGRSQLQISRLIVPSTLHGQVPFNILFLPFDALITVFGGTLNAILPKSVSSISNGIRQVLDDAGRLGIEKGTINLDFNQGKIICNKVEVDTKNLPDFTIKGSVSAADKLDFTIFIALLKMNLPLPVAGTLNTPLPDVVYLGPEIVRGLGLSIGNIAGGMVSLVTNPSSPEGTPSPPPDRK
jgi:hypothetical protein